MDVNQTSILIPGDQEVTRQRGRLDAVNVALVHSHLVHSHHLTILWLLPCMHAKEKCEKHLLLFQGFLSALLELEFPFGGMLDIAHVGEG
jgi:hypothetical protein